MFVACGAARRYGIRDMKWSNRYTRCHVWAGIYDPVAKRSRGGIQPRTEKVSAGYAWYDVCTWTPNEDEYFWIGPGRFGKDGNSSIKALWIDKLEFSRVSSGAVR